MTDIDFDELDKAVNSLMGTVPEPKSSDDDPKQKTLSISSTLKPDEKPHYDELEKVAKTIGNETLTLAGERDTVEELKSTLPTTKMNVSELDTLVKNETTALANAELGVTSQPVETPQPITEPVPAPEPVSVPTPTTVEPTPPVEATAPRPAAPAAALHSTPAVKRPSSGRFMDVVHPSSDMRSSTGAPTLSVPERSPVEKVPTVADVLPVPDTSSALAAVRPSTPTVEQPVVPPITEEPPKPEAAPEPAPAPVEEPKPEPTPEATPVPEAVVPAISVPEPTPVAESAPLTPFLPDAKVEKRPLGDPSAPAAPVTSGFGAGSFESTDKLLDAGDEDKASDTAVTPLSAATAPSIRAVESGDTGALIDKTAADNAPDESEEKDGDIFDVGGLPKPISRPAKQKSGWGVIVIIIVIIVLAMVAAGAAYYFLLGSK